MVSVRLCLALAVLACLSVLVQPTAALNPVAARFLHRTDAAVPLVLTEEPAEITTEEDAPMPVPAQEDVPETDEADTDAHHGDGQLGAVSVCAQRGGTCKDTSSGCGGGSFATGLCPGAANIKCCLVANTACSARGGSCRHTSVGCSGSFASGLCPGETEIKCCLPAASACASRGGTCKDTSTGCSGTFQRGLCPGGASNQCCLSACGARGGTCKDTSSGCGGGSFERGLCPGGASNQCCIPGGGGGGGCGAYAGAPTQSIIGNGNQAFAVAKILREHLSNPREYDASPNDEDNTMILSTACAFDRMRNAARAAGVSLSINSGFRTYARQQYFWHCYQTKSCNNGNVAAYPGTSNHGVGLALDIQISHYWWMAQNAHSFGFVRTVQSETWHWEHRPGAPPAPYT